MSLEDDILSAVKDLIRRAKQITTYAGVVSAVDTANKVISVIVDGANAATPCLPLAHYDIAVGQRVTVMQASATYYVIGVLGFKSVVTLPGYTGTHPTGTVPGQMWYRTDTNHAYVNVNGTPTQVDN